MVHEPLMTSEERALGARIDAAAWGVFFVWVGLALLANLGWGVGLIGAGAIMLGAQAWRSVAGVRVDRFAAIVGVLFAVVGIGNLLGLRVEVVPLLFIAAGVGILASTWRRAHGHHGGLNPPAHPPAPGSPS